jgi:hypothetical protein
MSYSDGYDYDDYGYGDDFAEPGGRSALRAASSSNPRNKPCPTCGHPNRLTPADVSRGYQCNSCADAMERGGEIDYYEGPEELTPEIIAAHCKLTFEVIYEPCGAKVTVEGAGTKTIRVIVAFPNNQSLDFVHRVCSDGDNMKLHFEREGYYAGVVVDLEGSLI